MDFLGLFIPEAMCEVQGAKVMMVVFDASLGYFAKQMEHVRNNPLSPAEMARWTTKMTWVVAKLHNTAYCVAQKIGADFEALFRAGLQYDLASVRQMTDVPRAVADITNVSQLLKRMIDEKLEKHMHIFRTVYELPVVQVEREIGDKCTICFEDFTEGEFLAMLPCGHPFHTNCILSWFLNNPSCPIDRRRIME